MIDSTLIATRDVTLDAGASQTETFTTSKDDIGEYAVEINGLSDTFVVKTPRMVTAILSPATFTTSDLIIYPTQVDIEEDITISVLVTNTGELTGSYTVIFKIDNMTEATKVVSLTGGASQTLAFTIAKDVVGIYTVNVDGLPSTFTVKAPPTPAAFTTNDLTISSTQVDIGEDITISVLVTNTGELTGSYKVTLKIDNMTEATKVASLTGGTSQTVAFIIAKDMEGSYTVNIDGEIGQFRVIIPQPLTPPTNWGFIGGIVAGCVVVAGLLVYFLVWRKRSTPRVS